MHARHHARERRGWYKGNHHCFVRLASVTAFRQSANASHFSKLRGIARRRSSHCYFVFAARPNSKPGHAFGHSNNATVCPTSGRDLVAAIFSTERGCCPACRLTAAVNTRCRHCRSPYTVGCRGSAAIRSVRPTYPAPGILNPSENAANQFQLHPRHHHGRSQHNRGSGPFAGLERRGLV